MAPSAITARVITRALLINVGTQVINIIKLRTLAGEFLAGSTGGRTYSRTPMPLPLSGLPAFARTKKNLKMLVAAGEARIFTSLRSRATWIILTGGYEQFRKLAGRETDHVTLNWTGSMMRNLKIVRVDTTTPEVVVGFDEGRSGRLASYHNTLGAGKRHVTHKFLGLTDEETRSLEQSVLQALRFAEV